MTGRRPARAAWRWIAWAAVVIASGLGLGRYKIDNDIGRWTPELAGVERRADSAVIGFERDEHDAGALAARLAGRPGIAAAVPLRGAGAMDGVLVLGRPGPQPGPLAGEIGAALGPDAGRVALAGPSIFRAALDDWSQRGLPLATGLIVVIGAVVMAVSTRRLRSVVEAVVAVFSSQVALVGVIAATGTPMNMVLSMTPPLLMGLGFSYAAHRALRPGVNAALRLSVATTAVALASFAFADFQPIRSFALWSTVGLGLTWMAVMLLVTPPSGPHVVPRARGGRCGWSLPAAWLVALAGVVVTIAGTAALPGLDVQRDMIAFFPAEARIARDYRRLDRELIGTLPFVVEVEDAAADPTAVVQATEGVCRAIRLDGGGPDGGAVYLGLARSDAVTAMAAAQPAWHDWAASQGTTLHWRGVAAQLDHIARAVRRTAAWALPVMLLIAGAVAYAIDRRWSTVALSVWINGFPLAVLGLVMAWCDSAVGLPTVLISALAVGVAIDDTLHILMARRRLGSIHEAVAACRRPCVGSSVAMAACMSAFLLCPFRPTAEFGALMALAVLAALAGDVLLLPAAARVLRADRARRHQLTGTVMGTGPSPAASG